MYACSKSYALRCVCDSKKRIYLYDHICVGKVVFTITFYLTYEYIWMYTINCVFLYLNGGKIDVLNYKQNNCLQFQHDKNTYPTGKHCAYIHKHNQIGSLQPGCCWSPRSISVQLCVQRPCTMLLGRFLPSSHDSWCETGSAWVYRDVTIV